MSEKGCEDLEPPLSVCRIGGAVLKCVVCGVCWLAAGMWYEVKKDTGRYLQLCYSKQGLTKHKYSSEFGVFGFEVYILCKMFRVLICFKKRGTWLFAHMHAKRQAWL